MEKEQQPVPSRYAARGVSATKDEVHAVVDKLDRGLLPGAFCKVTEDLLTGNPEWCNLIHADGCGTKSLLAWLHWQETGSTEAFRGIAIDSIVMNLDDLLCVGVAGRILLSSTVNRNARNFPGECLAALIEGGEDFLGKMRGLGVDIISGGGETADVGDLTPTCTIDTTAVAVMPRAELIDNHRIQPGLTIVGLASGGQAGWEEQPNSGIGSNGLTSARHDMLSSHYRETYPQTWDPGTDRSVLYTGPYRLSDPLPESSQSVGEALLSPTRTYAPLLVPLLREQREKIYGLVHCSGGGQTKCLRFGHQVHFIKDQLFTPPPLFRAIAKASGTSPKEMHQVFNMGHRMEIYCKPEDAPFFIEAAKARSIDAKVIGRTEASTLPDQKNHLTLTPSGSQEPLEYSLG